MHQGPYRNRDPLRFGCGARVKTECRGSQPSDLLAEPLVEFAFRPHVRTLEHGTAGGAQRQDLGRSVYMHRQLTGCERAVRIHIRAPRIEGAAACGLELAARHGA